MRSTAVIAWVVAGVTLYECEVRFADYEGDAKIVRIPGVMGAAVRREDIVPAGSWFVTRDSAVHKAARNQEVTCIAQRTIVNDLDRLVKKHPGYYDNDLAVARQRLGDMEYDLKVIRTSGPVFYRLAASF